MSPKPVLPVGATGLGPPACDLADGVADPPADGGLGWPRR